MVLTSIKNALLLLILSVFVSGCINNQTVADRAEGELTRPIQRSPLLIPAPEPLSFETTPEWIIVTENNVDQIIQDAKDNGVENPVFFALTPNGYQRLSITIAEIRNFINTQRTILNQYKLYYEPQNYFND